MTIDLYEILGTIFWLVIIIGFIYLKAKRSNALLGYKPTGKYSTQTPKQEYYDTSYYLFTRNEYEKVKNDAGLWGEFIIFWQLKSYEKDGGRFLYNIYLPKEDGTTSEMDMLFLTTKGLFVIESKNFSGKIYGSKDDIFWTQQLNPYTKFSFQNPIKQNEKHIQYLKKQLNIEIPIYSLVVFSGKTILKKVPSSTNDTYIIRVRDIKQIIGSILYKSKDCISHRELDEIQKSLFAFSQKSDAEKEKHISDIKTRYNKIDKKEPVHNIANHNLDEELKQALIKFRSERSTSLNMKAYFVFNNEEMEKLVKYKPITVEKLRKLKILPQIKINSHGREIVEIIRRVIEKNMK